MRIDGHVHVIGTGSGGSGCWYRPRGLTRIGEPVLLRAMGLRAADLRGNFEEIYVEALRRQIAAAGLDAVVILAHEEPYRDDGALIADTGSFYVPNDYVLGLARRHPELIPAVSIHPARRDALAELERCIEGGAAVLKCLPNCQNMDWNERRYRPFLERMAEAGILLLAHTGSERTMPVLQPRFASPRILTQALEVGVTCIAAHCGTGMMVLDPDYFDDFVAMTKIYPNLYGDNSALAGLSLRFRPWQMAKIREDPELAARLLYGSDLPVPPSGLVMAALGMMGWRDYHQSRREKDALARDVMLKRVLGFPPETETRLSGLLRGSSG
ncbi:MAG: amidohydrolase family protein [Luteolibacter sp.]|nr:amidohydrolase family protein [Luteolibacter sp.]